MKHINKLILLVSAFLYFSSSIFAGQHDNIIISKLRFDRCFTFPTCSFYIDDEEQLKVAQINGFYLPKIMIQMEDLHFINYNKTCTENITKKGSVRQEIWIRLAEKLTDSESIVGKGRKFRSSLIGELSIDSQRSSDVVHRLIEKYCEEAIK